MTKTILTAIYLLALLTTATYSVHAADINAFVVNTSNGSSLSFLNTEDGSQKAGIALGVETTSPAVYSGERAFVTLNNSNANTIVGYSLVTARPVGSATLPVETILRAVPVPNKGEIFLLTSRTNNQVGLYTLDAQSFKYRQVYAPSTSISAIAVSPNASTVYLATPNTVLFLDATTFHLKKTVLIGGVLQITPSPDDTRLYLSQASGNSGNIIAFNLANSSVAGTISADPGAFAAVSPDSSTVYTTLSAVGDTGPIELEQISASSLSITQTLTVGSVAYTSPGPILTMSPSGATLAVAASSTPALSITEVSLTGLAIGSISPVGNVCGIQYLSSEELSVTNCYANTVQIVDITAQKVKAQLDAGPSPQNLLLGANGEVLYVSNPYGVWALDAKSGQVLSKVEFPIQSSSVELALSTDGQTLFASYNSGVAEISTVNNSLEGYVSGIPTGLSVGGIATSATGKYLFVAGRADDSPEDYRLLVLDQSTGALLSNSAAPVMAVYLVVAPDGSSVYTEGSVQDAFYEIVIFNVAAGTFSGTTLEANGGGIAITSDGRTLYVPSSVNGTIQAFDTSTQTSVNLASPVQPANVAVTPDSSSLVITSQVDYLGLINLSNPGVGTEIAVNAATAGITVR